MVWKDIEEATCTKCEFKPKDEQVQRYGFGCVFKPPPNFEIDEYLLKSHLPKPKDVGQDKIKTSSEDSSGPSSPTTHSPKFEETVRTFTLISTTATITVVSMAFIMTILIAIKICIL